jgi:hypothetical protein
MTDLAQLGRIWLKEDLFGSEEKFGSKQVDLVQRGSICLKAGGFGSKRADLIKKGRISLR